MASRVNTKTEARKRYIAEWAQKAHRSPSEVYVPEALQPFRCIRCGWNRYSLPELMIPGGIDGPGNHTHCKEGRW